jgi:hypothetical protein
LAALVGASVAVLERIPILMDGLTGAGIGAIVGGAIAYRRERIAARTRRGSVFDPRWLVIRWTLVGAGGGTVIHLIAAVS